MSRQVRFATFTIQQFEEGLAKALRAVVDRHGYKDVHLKKDKEARGEYAYKILVGIGHLYIHINSSITIGHVVNDGCGEDSIKINLVDGLSGIAAIPKQGYLQRIDTWQKNLEKRIEEMFQTAHNLDWCACGSPKRTFKKRDRSGTFYACCGWNTDYHKKALGRA